MQGTCVQHSAACKINTRYISFIKHFVAEGGEERRGNPINQDKGECMTV